jgi:hypothetical protein
LKARPKSIRTVIGRTTFSTRFIARLLKLQVGSFLLANDTMVRGGLSISVVARAEF